MALVSAFAFVAPAQAIPPLPTATLVDNYMMSSGAQLKEMAISPNGHYLFVVSYSENKLYRFDTITHDVQSVTTGTHPMGVDVSPDGTKVAVSNQGSDTVSLVDSGTLAVTTVAFTGATPYGVRFTPDGSKMIVSGNSPPSLYIYTLTSGLVETIPGVGSVTRYFDITSDGSKAYVAENSGDMLTQVELGGAHNVSPTYESALNGPMAVALSPDGAFAYVSSMASPNIATFDITGAALFTGTYAAGSQPAGLSFSPNGSLLAVANNGENFVTLIEVNTGRTFDIATGVVGNIRGGSSVTGPWSTVFSPGGTKVYAANEFTGEITEYSISPAAGAGSSAEYTPTPTSTPSASATATAAPTSSPSLSITSSASPLAAPLANTGQNVAPVIVTAAMLIMGGAVLLALVLLVRRRTRR